MAAILTGELNPPVLCTDSVNVALCPWVIVRLVASAEAVNPPAAAGLMVTVTGISRVGKPLREARSVTVWVPVAVELLVFFLTRVSSVLLAGGVTVSCVQNALV